MIIREFGKHFKSDGGALTLSVSEVSCKSPEDGVHSKKHKDGWTIKGRVHEDYYTWVNDFTAQHPKYGKVWGDFESKVFADSKKAFDNFYKNHKPSAWDYWDI